MRYDWSLPPSQLAGGIVRSVDRVLIELDEPQLVVLRDGQGKRYLGHSADAEDRVERWIHTETTDLELEALCRGGVSMRAALSKKTIELVDYVDERPVAMWRISPNDVPSGIMPVRDANLPQDTGATALVALGLKKPSVGVPLLRCAGASVIDHTIGFLALSAIANTVQRLWSALAATVLPEALSPDALTRVARASTLRMAVPVVGSFGITVARSQEEDFRLIGEAYRSALRSSPEQAIASMHGEVLTTYAAHLKTVEMYGTEVFAEWGPGASVYLGPGYAGFAKAHLRGHRRRALGAASTQAVRGGYVAHGVFRAVNLDKKTFSFFDELRGVTVAGRIKAAIVKKLEAAGGEVAVGRRTMYSVRIERPAREAVLSELNPLQASLFS